MTPTYEPSLNIVLQHKHTNDADIGGPYAASVPTSPAELKVGTLVVSPRVGADYQTTGTADQTIINNAITALPVTGGKVILRDGIYNISGPIVINKSNVILEGFGEGTQINLSNASNKDCVQMGDGSNSYSNIKVTKVLIDGGMGNQTATSHGVNILANITNGVVEECTIQNTYGANININASTAANCKVINNYLNTTRSTKGWANMEGGGNYCLIEGNYCNAGDFDGIDLYHGVNHTISNNIITNPNASNYGIEASAWGSVVNNNQIYTTTNLTAGISIENSHITCTGNTIFVDTGNTAAVVGITVPATHSDISISGNVITFNTAQAHIGIRFLSTTEVACSGNSIYFISAITTNSVGIGRTSGSPVDLAIYGNSIYGFDLAIDLTSCFDSVVSGNTIDGCNNGIKLDASANILITGNSMFGKVTTGGDGISAQSTSVTSSQISIVSNNISNFAQNAIILQRVQYSSIVGNTIDGCGQKTNNTYSGIILKTSTASSIYNIINGNTITSSKANKHQYGIREDSSSDGPTIVTSNITLNAVTTQISTQNTNTDVSHNITS